MTCWKGHTCFGVHSLSFQYLNLLADSGRRQLAKGERRENKVNDALVPALYLMFHPLLRAFITRLQQNEGLPYEVCVSHFSRLFAYNEGVGRRRLQPMKKALHPCNPRLKVPGVRLAIRALQNVFEEEYIGLLYKEEFQAARNAYMDANNPSSDRMPTGE
jgi:hypothetical protein